MRKKKGHFLGSVRDFGKSLSKKERKSFCVDGWPEDLVEKDREVTQYLEFGKPCQWSEAKHNTFFTTGRSFKTLKSGLYNIEMVNGKSIFVKQEIATDDLIEFKDDISFKLLMEIEDFWNAHSAFENYGFLHRRGYLFYGPAGSGKTAIVQQIVKRIINRDGIVFICSYPKFLQEGLPNFRRVEPDRNIVCLFEDIDALIDRFGEEDLLSLLDGETQINRVLNIATTNYPEKLDKRLVGRPRRFDRVILIDMPNKKVREEYFSKKLKIDNKEALEWAEKSEGFSFAALADLVISVKCLGNSFEDTLKLLKDLEESKLSSDSYYKSKTGFIK